MARLGSQIPTVSFVLPYEETKGDLAINLYEETGREAIEWQNLLTNDILAVNEDGLWVHTKFGYSVPRRNGKNEVVTIRELFGLHTGERILHTAHRTTTSHAAAIRLASLLDDMGYEEVVKKKKDEVYDKHYTFTKQFGLEKITLLGANGGSVDFRTRTSKGGLGEGFDLLIIDEAQEYTDDQESSLKYVVSDSMNPQILMCGTPPTAVSSGEVFPKYRKDMINGKLEDSGWAEWSVDTMTDVHDIEAWYRTNPSLGVILTERKIKAEITNDDVDFNIQRLGLWLDYDQASDITEADWKLTEINKKPKLKGGLYIGIKFGKDGVNTALTVACRTSDDRIFLSAYDCRNRREGNGWIINFIQNTPKIEKVVVDGASGQDILENDMKVNGLKKPIFPKVKELIQAFAMFEQATFNDGIRHMPQEGLDNIVTHCQKRPIGTNGGFGYKSNSDLYEVALMESAVLAFWACHESKGTKGQKVQY